jgi:hypothetical protein
MGGKRRGDRGEIEADFTDSSDILEQFLYSFSFHTKVISGIQLWVWFFKKENSDFHCGSNSEDRTQYKSGLGYLDWNQRLIVG